MSRCKGVQVMSNRELKEWSEQMFKELKDLQNKEVRIHSRCCRAARSGVISIDSFKDPVLMQKYTLKLKYCPECGKKLNEYED